MGIELVTKNGNIKLTKPAGTGGGSVDLSNYYTKAEVDGLIPDVSGFITEIPAEYLTESELEGKGYITDIPEEYITEETLSTKGFATADDVAEAVSDKITIEDLDTATADFVTEEQMNTAITTALSNIGIAEEGAY